MPASLVLLITRLAGVLLAAALLGGCATAGKSAGPEAAEDAAAAARKKAARAPDPRDPFEPVNRGIYRFNDRLDKAVMRPTARVYQRVVPQFVRQSVSNAFLNVNDVRVAFNNAMQGKFVVAYADLGRVLINSTWGLLGLFDIASEAGIERHQEDFGQTLGWWGIPDGPYIMLPLFGPSNARDTAGWAVDYFTDPLTYVEPTRASNQITATKLVSRRAELLDASKVLDAAALDPYSFVRESYFQRRRNLVYDGKPPADKNTIEAPRPNTPPADAPQAK